MNSYSIIRHRYAGPSEVVKVRVSLAEAQEHCNRADTHGEGWFDGYKETLPRDYWGNYHTPRAKLLESAFHCLVYDNPDKPERTADWRRLT